MSKWVNIRCTSVKDVMVEIEDHETRDDVYSVLDNRMNEFETSFPEDVSPDNIDTYLRHADEVFRL